ANKDKFECYGTYVESQLEMEGVKAIRMDLRKRDETILLLNAIEPEIIIFAAKVDNEGEIIGYLVEEIKKMKCRLIYMSSDAVFDGNKGEYKEEDSPNPTEGYGRGKADSEKIIQAGLKDYAIIRASYIYGANSRGYGMMIKGLLESIRSGKPFPAYANVYKSPTFVDDLVEHAMKVAESDYRGIIHIAGERMSVYEFNKKVAEMISINGSIVKMEMAGQQSDTSLDSSKAKKLFGFAASPVEDCIAELD
ncbi:MAG: sugar nucleotide-binding protein, partial [Nanoarchaeota archaeon]